MWYGWPDYEIGGESEYTSRQVNIIQYVLIEMQILNPGSSDSFYNVLVWL